MNTNSSENTPEVIILMAHYNDHERVIKAVDSIKEPFKVDVLIVDDGSKIKPNEEELKSIYGDRGMLTVKFAPQNMGASKIRNWGLQMILESAANYKYIAVMDSDDTNKPNRISKQLHFLKENPEVALMGAWADYYTSSGEFIFTLKHPTTDKEIKKQMYLNSMFVHPSVIYKREVVENIGGYIEKYKKGGVEDYGFLFKAVKNYTVANYPEVLVNYTINENGLSSKQRFWQVFGRIRIIMDNFYFGIYPIYGIIRNSILLIAPRNLGIKLRKMLNIEKLSF